MNESKNNSNSKINDKSLNSSIDESETNETIAEIEEISRNWLKKMNDSHNNEENKDSLDNSMNIIDEIDEIVTKPTKLINSYELKQQDQSNNSNILSNSQEFETISNEYMLPLTQNHQIHEIESEILHKTLLFQSPMKETNKRNENNEFNERIYENYIQISPKIIEKSSILDLNSELEIMSGSYMSPLIQKYSMNENIIENNFNELNDSNVSKDSIISNSLNYVDISKDSNDSNDSLEVIGTPKSTKHIIKSTEKLMKNNSYNTEISPKVIKESIKVTNEAKEMKQTNETIIPSQPTIKPVGPKTP